MRVVLLVFVGLYFGWVKSLLDCVLPQRRAIAKLESLGVFVEYDDQHERRDHGFSTTLIQHYFGDLRRQPLTAVEHIHLSPSQPLPDKDLQLLVGLSETKNVSMRGRHITDRSMHYVDQLPELECLTLDSTCVTAFGLSHLSTAHGLKSLTFHNDDVSRDMLESFGTLSNLQELGFAATRFASADFEHLAGIRNLRSLAIMDSSVLRGLKNIDTLHSLELHLLMNVVIAEDGCSNLRSLSHLKSLTIQNTKVAESGLRDVSFLHELEKLDLQGMPFPIRMGRNVIVISSTNSA